MNSAGYPAIAVVIPAAGIGQRMQADKPKQYLLLHGKTVLEHTTRKLLNVAGVSRVFLALAEDDPYFSATPLAALSQVQRVTGGTERAYSVLNALQQIDSKQYPWVLVHDAARPLVRSDDISKLIAQCLQADCGGILACRVRDTMKRGSILQPATIDATVSREQLWHALTPQFFPTQLLKNVLADALQAGAVITDEASALEWAGQRVLLTEGHSDNIKITEPADLILAGFYLEQYSE